MPPIAAGRTGKAEFRGDQARAMFSAQVAFTRDAGRDGPGRVGDGNREQDVGARVRVVDVVAHFLAAFFFAGALTAASGLSFAFAAAARSFFTLAGSILQRLARASSGAGLVWKN